MIRKGTAWRNASGTRRTTEDDPRYHTIGIRGMPNDTITHVREDVSKISDATGQAFFETTAEVLGGLVKAYEDYEARSEGAWRG